MINLHKHDPSHCPHLKQGLRGKMKKSEAQECSSDLVALDWQAGKSTSVRIKNSSSSAQSFLISAVIVSLFNCSNWIITHHVVSVIICRWFCNFLLPPQDLLGWFSPSSSHKCLPKYRSLLRQKNRLIGCCSQRSLTANQEAAMLILKASRRFRRT